MAHPRELIPVPVRHVWTRWRAIETEASWFVLANFLDAAVTFMLLHRGETAGRFAVESNAIAKYFLDRWGFQGMFAFKLALVLLVCLIGLTIAFRREDTARGVLNFGTLVVTGVVLYSVWLYVQ